MSHQQKGTIHARSRRAHRIIRLCTPRGLLDDTPADPLADEDYPLSPLDRRTYRETVSRYQIRGLPTLLFFKDGQVQDTVVGAAPKGQLVQKLDAVLQAS